MSSGNRTLSRLVSLGLLCLCLGACGSGATGPPTVGLSILAPTDGSTVGVRALQLVGHVTPANAVVVVGHQAVQVRKGTFRQPLVLLGRLTHISVSATASGFRGASTVIAVRYAPKMFHHPAAARPHRAPARSAAPARVAKRQQSAVSRAADAEFMSSCQNSSGGMASYCGCMWNRLRSAGLDTEAKWEALVMQWRRTFLTKGVIVYPPAMKSAIVGCLSHAGLP